MNIISFWKCQSPILSFSVKLGFRIDPSERLEAVYREISSLHKTYSDSPIFGVEYSKHSSSSSTAAQQAEVEASLRNSVAEMDELNEIDESINNASDAFTAYLAEGGSQDKIERELVFCPELGLSIEKLRVRTSFWNAVLPTL